MRESPSPTSTGIQCSCERVVAREDFFTVARFSSGFFWCVVHLLFVVFLTLARSLAVVDLSLSSVFHAWAGCFPANLAAIAACTILKSAQTCILCAMWAELLISLCVVSQKLYQYRFLLFCLSLRTSRMLVAWCNDSTGVSYRSFKGALLEVWS